MSVPTPSLRLPQEPQPGSTLQQLKNVQDHDPAHHPSTTNPINRQKSSGLFRSMSQQPTHHTEPMPYSAVLWNTTLRTIQLTKNRATVSQWHAPRPDSRYTSRTQLHEAILSCLGSLTHPRSADDINLVQTKPTSSQYHRHRFHILCSNTDPSSQVVAQPRRKESMCQPKPLTSNSSIHVSPASDGTHEHGSCPTRRTYSAVHLAARKIKSGSEETHVKLSAESCERTPPKACRYRHQGT